MILSGVLGFAAQAQVLFDPADGLQGWEEVKAVGKTEFTEVPDGIRATTLDAASGIYRGINLDTDETPIVTWQWRVDDVQPSADLSIKGRDDVAASVSFIFGRPNILFPPPTLSYVWTNDSAEVGKIYTSTRTDSVKYLVLQAGDAPLSEWVSETRNLAEDYELAFGSPPPRNAKRLCLFTDADQTNERVTAYYGGVTAAMP